MPAGEQGRQTRPSRRTSLQPFKGITLIHAEEVFLKKTGGANISGNTALLAPLFRVPYTLRGLVPHLLSANSRLISAGQIYPEPFTLSGDEG